jgi:secretion/DNA translocation related TadE-like protein
MTMRGIRGDKGSGSLLMVGVMAVVLMFGLGGVCIAGYLLAAHQVRSSADLAALSGAAAFADGADACDAAKSNARSNHARVVDCDVVGDPLDFVVTVRAEVELDLRVPGLPRQLLAVAYAGSGSQ